MTESERLEAQIRLGRLETLETLRAIVGQVDSQITNIDKAIDAMQGQIQVLREIWVIREELGESTSGQIGELNSLGLRISLQEKLLVEAHQRRERYMNRCREIEKLLEEEAH